MESGRRELIMEECEWRRNQMSSVPGLFAAGEWRRHHGAKRLGGNSLSDLPFS